MIGKKIKEIRSKPEHIRERYVWVAVGICMALVFSVWLASLNISLKGNDSARSVSAPINGAEKDESSMK